MLSSGPYTHCNFSKSSIFAIETLSLFLFTDEFQNFVRKLPTFNALNTSAIQFFWKADAAVHQRYRQLEVSTQQLLSKARRIVNKLFTLSKRCRSQPQIVMLRER